MTTPISYKNGFYASLQNFILVKREAHSDCIFINEQLNPEHSRAKRSRLAGSSEKMSATATQMEELAFRSMDETFG